MLTNAIIMEDIYILSDAQIQKKIGEKIKTTRLKQNITQDSLVTLHPYRVHRSKKWNPGR